MKYKTILADPPWNLGEMRMKKARPNAILPYPKPRIELFARNKRNGWDVWGNEVENDITL